MQGEVQLFAIAHQRSRVYLWFLLIVPATHGTPLPLSAKRSAREGRSIERERGPARHFQDPLHACASREVQLRNRVPEAQGVHRGRQVIGLALTERVVPRVYGSGSALEYVDVRSRTGSTENALRGAGDG